MAISTFEMKNFVPKRMVFGNPVTIVVIYVEELIIV